MKITKLGNCLTLSSQVDWVTGPHKWISLRPRIS